MLQQHKNIRVKMNKTDIPVGTFVIIQAEQSVVGIYLDSNKIDEVPLIPYYDSFKTRTWFRGVVTEEGIKAIRFANLHCHSYGSLLDGMMSPEEIAELVEYYGAVTDHGVMFNYNRFDLACGKLGKVAIKGFEGYCERIDGVKDLNHLVLLAETEEGLSNIIKLCSKAWDNVYYKPHLKWEWLKQHSKGVIVLTACLGGEIPQLLEVGKREEAMTVLYKLIDIFGINNVFLEIQRHGIPEEDIVNPGIEWLSQETGVKIVATPDSHFAKESDSQYHELQLCLQMKQTITDPNHYKFQGTGYHFPTSDEMVELFSDHLEWLDNTLDIAERCSNVKIERGNYKLPIFPLPEGFTDQGDYLEYLCFEGFKKRFEGTSKINNPTYHERLRYELDVIRKTGYPGYFVIVSDLVMFAKANEILVGPGRGSAAGSLVAYVTFITDIDPIEYNLLFERFLNPERISMPDIDIDFQDDRREEVIDYAKSKYQEEYVSRIGTFGTMKARQAPRDIRRALNYPMDLGNRISKAVGKSETLKTALTESPELLQIYQSDSRAKEIIDIAMKLEGIPRNISSHACGLIISDKPVSDYIPQIKTKNPITKLPEIATQITMGECEALGLLKIDLLGLRTLGVISETLKLINLRSDTANKMTSDDIPIEDIRVYESLSKGNTSGVFQLESSGMTNLMKQMYQDLDKLKEQDDAGRECFERLVAGLSLYRPGPMEEIPNYIKFMLNPEKIHYEIPQLSKYLSNTYSIITYQEQVMQIVRELAGFSKGDADGVRKGMGKKEQDIIDEYGEYFIYGSEKKNIPGSINNGIEEKMAVELWSKMMKFGKYAFNRSHAVAYGVIVAKTAWLAHYYPIEYMTAILNSYITNADRIRLYTASCIQRNIQILPPNINKSQEKFSIDGDGIRFGLRGLRNVGGFSSELIEIRERCGKFESFQDFYLKIARYSILNKSSIEALIYSGTLDDFEGTRNAKLNMMSQLSEIADFAAATKKTGRESFVTWVLNQRTNRNLISLQNMLTIKTPDLEEFDKTLKLEKEYEYANFYITEHPVDRYAHILANEEIEPICLLNDTEEETDEHSNEQEFSTFAYERKVEINDDVVIAGVIKEVKVIYIKKRQSRMAVCQLQDRTGTIEVIVFGEKYERRVHLFEKGTVIKIKGKYTKDNFGYKVMANSIIDLKAQAEGKTLQHIEVYSNENIELAREQYRRLQQITKATPGETEIIFYNRSNMKYYIMSEKIQSTTQTIQQLKYLFGEEYIKFVSQ